MKTDQTEGLDSILKGLESRGIIEKTGEFRLGNPKWRLTEFASKLSKEELDFLAGAPTGQAN
jgi:hypothetical protein